MTDTTTALAFTLPKEFVENVNSIRQKYDKAVNRWPPHINFLFPFVSSDQFENTKEKLKDLGDQESFNVVFKELGFFSQRKGNITFHLKLDKESDEKIKKIYKMILASLPGFPIKEKAYHPHLTLGQCKTAEWPKLEIELKAWLGEGLTVKCDKIVFFHRTPESGDKMVEENNVLLKN